MITDRQVAASFAAVEILEKREADLGFGPLDRAVYPPIYATEARQRVREWAQTHPATAASLSDIYRTVLIAAPIR